MSTRRLAKVPLFGNAAKAVTVEAGATVGAQIGVNLLMPDGSLATTVKLQALFGDGTSSDGSINTTDDLEEGAWNLWFTDRRAQDAVGDILADTATIDLEYVAGTSITATLKDLSDSGTGAALVKITRDSKGRLSGSSAASTTDLTEGTNLYYTDERAQDAIGAALDGTGNVPLTYDDAGNKVSAALSSGVLASLTLADSAVQSVVAGTGVSVDNTDPQNPVISTTGSGSGDVVGPASAVDGDIALFDGITGKLIKSGGALATAVQSVVLTGLSLATSAVIAATDTVLQAFGKLQAQITDNLLPAGYIDGLKMVWVSGTALTVTSGAAYVPSLSKVLRASSDIAKTGLSLTASTWYHVYLYSNAGTPDVEISTAAPASPYSGTARTKTGDTSRRYVGSVLTDAAGNVSGFKQTGQTVLYLANILAAPFLVAQGLTATTATTVSCAGAIPITAKIGIFTAINSDPAVAVVTGTSDQGYTLGANAFNGFVNPGMSVLGPFLLSASQAVQYMYRTSPTGSFAIRVSGYVFER